MPCSNSCCLLSTDALFGGCHHSLGLHRQGNRGSERGAGRGTTPPPYPGHLPPRRAFHRPQLHVRGLPECCLSVPLRRVCQWPSGEKPSAVHRLGSCSEAGQTKGPGPSCCHAAQSRLGRAGLMDQQSSHRGISSICLLTRDVRNVKQPQQLCACQGHWQGGTRARQSSPP